jgi:outer membrane receptor protein involved in Fe transport
LTAQHTGGGKAEQYFIRGFDADHGTDLAVYFDGVPINLRSHAHGQGFLDLHFVTRETIERLDAHKGPYSVRFGDFATAATVEYVPFDSFEESFVRLEGGAFDTFRAVAGLSPRQGVFAAGGPAEGFLSFEAYHTDGPFQSDEDLWRTSLLARGGVEIEPGLRVSGHALGYHADWKASGLIPESLVEAGLLSRWGSLDPSEGGDSTRAQGKLQVDWSPSPQGQLTANAYLAYYDLELFSNFTYFLVNDDAAVGDGIVQRDQDRLYTGGRIEYAHFFDAVVPARLLAGIETRYDDVDVALGTQTKRLFTGCERGSPGTGAPCAKTRVHELSVEPYLEAELTPLEWVQLDAGLRFAWFRTEGVDLLDGRDEGVADDTLWLPKANLVVSPFSTGSPWPSGIDALRHLELFVNFGIGYHSNDARAVFADPAARTLPQATGVEVGLRTRLHERLEIALDGWFLNLEDELVFVGDEGTTESVGETDRHGVELVTSLWLLEWLYLRGDLAYTDARLAGTDLPVPQAPRFVAKGVLGARWEGLAAELAVRHLGERDASELSSDPSLSGYTVLDLAARYRWRFLELGLAVENLTDTDWRSSEFFYESRPAPGGAASEDFHFTPGNPLNVRAWLTAHF